MGFQLGLEGAQIVVVEAMGQFAYTLGHPQMAGGGADVPVLPSVIAADGDPLPTGDGAGEADAGGGGIGAVLAKAHHLGAGDKLDQLFGNLGLKAVGQREDGAEIELLQHGLVHILVAVTQADGQQAAGKVEILVAIHVPYLGALATLDKERRGAIGEAEAALGEGLGA
ncbi:hypothetical protein D3C86_1327250 [compost metagenome]